MAQGDKLHSLLYPNALEVQVRRLKRQLARAQHYATTGLSGTRGEGVMGGGGNGEGMNGPIPQVPTPNAEDIAVTVALEVLKDGTFQPTLAVVVDPSYEQVRGFMGYRVRLTSPEGEQRIITVGTVETADGIVADSLTTRNLALPPVADASTTWQVEVQVRSSIFGEGAWSERVAAVLSSDTTPPDDPLDLPGIAARTGVLDITWDPCVAPDYAYTEVYKGMDLFTLGGAAELAATVAGGAASIPWDAGVDFVTNSYNSIRIRHIDTSGNASGLGPAATISVGLSNATKVAGGVLSSAISYSGTLTLAGGGVVTGGGLTLTSSGAVAQGSTAFQVADDNGVLLGGLYGTGTAAFGTQAVVVSSSKRITLVSTNEIQLTSPERVYLFSNPTGSGQVRLNASSLLFDGPITASGSMTIPAATVGGTAAQSGDAPLEVQGSSAGLVVHDRTGGSSERWVVYSNRTLGAGTQTLRWKTNGADRMTLSATGGMTLVTAVLSGALTAASATINGVLSAASLLINGTKLTVGSSFPGSPSSGDTHYRSDLGVWCRYDGSRWLGPEETFVFMPRAGTLMPWTANDYVQHGPVRTDRALYFTRWVADMFVSGTNNGSNYWAAQLYLFSTQIASVNTSAVANGDWRLFEATSFSTNPGATTSRYLEVAIAKTGAPGGLYMTCTLYCKQVYT